MRRLRYVMLVPLLALSACKGGTSAAQYPATSAAATSKHYATPDPSPAGHHEHGIQVREYQTGGHHPGTHPMPTPPRSGTATPPRTPTPPGNRMAVPVSTWTAKPVRTWAPRRTVTATATPPSTVTPYPDNTSADPVNLGTKTLTYDDAGGDACASTGEDLPVPEGP